MRCYLCNSTEFSKRPGAVRDAPSLDVLECKACGLVTLSSFDHIADGHYEDAGMYGDDLPEIENFMREREADDERRYRSLLPMITGREVLDFGCGTGGFLLKARGLAARAEGLELERRLQPHFSRHGLKVHLGLGQIAPESFDLITAFHVVEHIKNPREVLRDLAPLLKTDGSLVVEVPSAQDALLTLYGSDAFSRFTYWSQHLFLFTQSTLAELVKQSGLRLLWQKQVQRYPLSNHLHWLAKNQPGGHRIWSFLDSAELNSQYESQLAALGHCDTLVAGIGRA